MTNYRLVSTIPNASKLFEQRLYDQKASNFDNELSKY